MARRRVSELRSFHGDQELENVHWFALDESGAPRGDRYPNEQDGPDRMARFGTPKGVALIDVIDNTVAGPRFGGRRDWLRVERTVKYLRDPDPHHCDWRCEGASPNSECRCECGGKNHGRRGRQAAGA
jgi:hypothetical protein